MTVSRTGVSRASGEREAERPTQRTGRRLVFSALLAGLLAVSGLSALPPVDARAAGERLKAVIIVGPTGSLTSSNLADGEALARSAEAQGMDVRRIFHPNATWERVLANIQGASLVVYMGHGNGWPSPYGPFQEKTKNGFGLNPYAGGSASKHTYYGAGPIRNNVVLAPNAVVLLIHLCYASGNAEPGMAIPSEDIARQRVDNFAAGFLAAGARVVFSFGWNQSLDYARALNTTDLSMDELFMTAGGGRPSGFIGWRNKRFASVRTPGAVNHLDPHPTHGYYRAVTGDLSMTAAEWRAASAASMSAEPPEITSLEAAGPTSAAGLADMPPRAVFHPNGDGLADVLLVRHTVSRAAFLDVTVANAADEPVRRYTVWSPQGAGSSTWNGRADDGRFVADGRYSLTYVPRDSWGNVGSAVSTQALVLSSVAVPPPSKAALYPRDGDRLATTSRLSVTVNQRAHVWWMIADGSGTIVRTLRDGAIADPTTLSLAWDGRDEQGAWLPDGFYRSVVTSRTDLGEYTHERLVYVGAFRLAASTESVRGRAVKFIVRSTEPLGTRPRLTISQPGLAPYTVALNHVSGRKYRARVLLRSGGAAGDMTLVVRGNDRNGQAQQTVHRLPIR